MNKLIFGLFLWGAAIGFVGSAAAQPKQQPQDSLPRIGPDMYFYCKCGANEPQNGSYFQSSDPKVKLANYHQCPKCNHRFSIEYFTYNHTSVRIIDITKHKCNQPCIKESIEKGPSETYYKKLERICGFQDPVDLIIIDKATKQRIRSYRLNKTVTTIRVPIKSGDNFSYYLQPVQEADAQGTQPAPRRNRPGSRQ